MRRLDAGDDPMTGGLTGLVRTVLTTSGPVALLAIALTVFLGYFVWDRLSVIEHNQGTILGEMNKANVEMTGFVKQHQEIEAERAILLRSQVNLLRQLCVNSARTELQTRACAAE